MAEDPAFYNEQDTALIFILQAAANYLALRANSSPNYNGLQLDTEEGWAQMTALFDAVAHSGS